MMRKKGAGIYPPLDSDYSLLEAVIQLELERVGRHAKARQLFFLESDIRVQHVVGKHTAARQEFAVFVELLQRLLERMAYLGNARGDFRWQVIQILVDRIAGLDLVLDAVQ